MQACIDRWTDGRGGQFSLDRLETDAGLRRRARWLLEKSASWNSSRTFSSNRMQLSNTNANDGSFAFFLLTK